MTTWTVSELIEHLSTWYKPENKVFIKVDHGNLRSIVGRKVTKEKLNDQITLVSSEEESEVVVIQV